MFESCLLHAEIASLPQEPAISDYPPSETAPEPTENGTAAAHSEEQVASEAMPAGLPRVQTETAAFSTSEKDQLSSPHLTAATKGQVLRTKHRDVARNPPP